MAVTLATLLTRLRREVADPTGRRLEDAELIDDINQAVRGVMRQIATTWPDYYMRTSLTQKDQQNLVDGTANYDLPSDFYLPVMVTTEDSDGDVTKRDVLTFERTLDSDADGYYLRDDDIHLFDTPDANVTNGLTIYYLARQTEVTTLATAVPLADDFQDAIVGWAVIKAKARQEESAGDYGAIYREIDEQLKGLTVRVNEPTEAGLHVLWRDWL